MSVINQSPFPGGLGSAPMPELELSGSARGAAQGGGAQADNVRTTWNPAPLPTAFAEPGSASGGFGDPQNSLALFGSVMSGILNSLQGMLASLGSAFGAGGAAGGGGQTYFTNATASSTGDPHESLSGTNGAGNAVAGTWDSMASHQHLLDSDSFAGGYNVATIVTPPSGKGATMNDSATVTTNGGATSVTMHHDGSYAVSENGQSVGLQPGQTLALGNGASLTLNADQSLTETATNAAGGTIATTLRSNGQGGVDVSTVANNVDLGGYLVGRSDTAPAAPIPIAYPGGAQPGDPTPLYQAQLESAYANESALTQSADGARQYELAANSELA